jgi:ABC-type branched-subunit amino acid transport system substrate-binding protein
MPPYPVSSGRAVRNRNGCANVVGGVIATLTVIGIVLGYLMVAPDNTIKNLACSYVPGLFFCHIIDSTSVQINQDLLSVGLSVGQTAFDLRSSDSQDKQQAITEMDAGHVDAAIQDWQHALTTVTDDAEAMIYIENAQVAASGRHYLTIVAATTLSETPGDNSASVSVGRDDLRGIYMAQHSFNAQHSNLKLRVVLANFGINNQTYLAQTEPLVLQRIVRLAASDPTFIGVVGFPFSAAAQLAIPVLAQHHIPLISPSASATLLTSLSPYFFRVVPPDLQQGAVAAQFASQVLGARHVAVFSDSMNAYSKSLGEGFTQAFTGSGSNYTVVPVPMTVHNADSITSAVAHIVHANVDLIFLAGYADDIDHLKTQLAQQNLSIEVMGGDAAYEFGGYTQGNYRDLYFTAFTYPDVWNILCPGSSCGEVPLAADPKAYAATFDPHNQHPEEYGYERMGPHVWLSYDSVNVLLNAATMILSDSESVQLDAMQQAIERGSFQGASGLISFQGGNPIDKTVVILCLDSKGHTQIVHAYGKFARGATPPSLDSSYVRNSLCA